MNLTIRKAVGKDIDAVIDLATEMVVYSLSPYRDTTSEDVKDFRRKDLAILKNVHKYQHVSIFIAEDEEKHFIGHVIVVSGDIETSTGERQGWIFDLSVKKVYWGTGVGRRLMDEAELFVKEQGLKYLGMGVTSSNTHAVQFYEKLGFVEERKRMIKKI